LRNPLGVVSVPMQRGSSTFPRSASRGLRVLGSVDPQMRCSPPVTTPLARALPRMNALQRSHTHSTP
ncbi:hypothetical protein T492DRAFT_944302, partial [Pavlovales sp. CCMP2436]